MQLERFSLTPAIINRILTVAMSRGANFADLYCEYSRYEGLGLEEGILKSASASIECGAGVRVVEGEKTGYAYTEVMEESHFQRAARTAAAIAHQGGDQKAVQVAPFGIGAFYPVPDPVIDEPMPRKIDLIYLADKTARAHHSDVKQVSVYLGTAHKLILMADSRGRLVQDIQPMIRFTVSVVVERGGERQTAMAGDGGRLGASFLTRELAIELSIKAVDEALLLLDARPAPSGI